ncbi:glycoside hydrolase family 25 protein [Streptomyces sp. NPDC001668]|uniref:glycoside hydrolase family 25 protein n=1 Tax=unclassified Streptomyces TaxID=2593676 RepID=UPI0036855C41
MRTHRRLTRAALTAVAAVLALTGAVTAAPAAESPAALGPGAYSVHGIDISRYQHPGNKAIDWGRVSRSGQKFVSVKATEGTRTVSPWFVRDLAGARSVRMIHTAYHYFDPAQDGRLQADHFLSTVGRQHLDGHQPYQLPLELDLEGPCKVGPGAFESRVLAFLNRVEAATGVEPVVYTQRSYVNHCMAGSKALGKYRVRLARYSNNPPPALPGGTGWHFWQFTEKATVPGVPAKTDENVFNGSYQALRNLANLR